MLKRLSLLALLGLMAACQIEQNPPVESGGPVAEFEAEAEACRAEGGQPVVGLRPVLSCSFPTPDAGKACTSSEQCESFCLADGASSGGMCAPQTIMFGCFDTYENGRKATLCVD